MSKKFEFKCYRSIEEVAFLTVNADSYEDAYDKLDDKWNNLDWGSSGGEESTITYLRKKDGTYEEVDNT